MTAHPPRPQTGIRRIQPRLAATWLCLLLPLGAEAPGLLDPARSATLVVLAPESNPVAQAAAAALADPDGVELDLGLVRVDPSRPSQRSAELRAAVPGLPRTGWALVSPAGALLGSGTAPPGVPELARTLAAAGIQPPIQALRAFVRLHPGQLEARSELLRRLRQGAIARTRAHLDLPALPEGADAQDLSPYQGRRLKDVEDLEIWASYAQELDRAFQDGSWRSMDLAMGRGLPVEVCSPTVQGLYARNLAKVETALSVLPGASAYWEVWLRMSLVSGLNHGRTLIAGLVVPPPEARLPWPPAGVVSVLVRDATQRGDWQRVRDLLQPFWEGWRGTKSKRASEEWASTLGPLLEAMIRLREDDEAGALVEGLVEVRALVQRASVLATACKRPDLARRWAALGR